MAIKKFEDKGLRPEKRLPENKKNAIIETKEIEYCYPDYGVTIKATSKEEADKKLKDFKIK